MVAVQQGKVLVTGANGFIAMWVVKCLLDRGYSVRGTVRSDRKATHVREVFSKFELWCRAAEQISSVSVTACRIGDEFF